MILLDTCALLWLAADQERLSPRAREAIREHAGELFVSSISAFEIAIKARRGKIEFPMEPGVWFKEVLDHHGLLEISVDGEIAARAVALPPLHNDPCDRFIIATALQHRMAVVTGDPFFAQYEGVRVIW